MNTCQRAKTYISTVAISDRKLHVGIIIGVWTLVYPYIAYVIYPRPWDEVEYYYPISSRMVAEGQWIIPRLPDGLPFLQKTPLVFWFQATSITVFDDSLFAARIPSILFGLATALLVYHMVQTLYDWRTGLTAGLVFLSAPMISIHNHSATTADLDIYLIFFGSAFVWLVWQRYDSTRWMAVAGITGAAAVLAKSLAPAIFLLTLAPVVIRHWRRYLSIQTLTGLVAGLTVLLPWPVYTYFQYPDRFVQKMVLRQINRAQGEFGSTTGALFPMADAPYFKRVFGLNDWALPLESLAPIGQTVAHISVPIFVYISLAGIAWLYRTDRLQVDRDLFILWWVISVPLFFSLTGGRHDWYLQPINVPLAMLVAVTFTLISDWVRSSQGVLALTHRQYVVLVTAGVLICYILWYLLSGAPATGPTTVSV